MSTDTPFIYLLKLPGGRSEYEFVLAEDYRTLERSLAQAKEEKGRLIAALEAKTGECDAALTLLRSLGAL